MSGLYFKYEGMAASQDRLSEFDIILTMVKPVPIEQLCEAVELMTDGNRKDFLDFLEESRCIPESSKDILFNEIEQDRKKLLVLYDYAGLSGSMDEIIEKIWDDLVDVPFNEDIEQSLYLAEDWQIFEKGTYREELWRWFDEHHSKGVHYLLYGE